MKEVGGNSRVAQVGGADQGNSEADVVDPAETGNGAFTAPAGCPAVRVSLLTAHSEAAGAATADESACPRSGVCPERGSKGAGGRGVEEMKRHRLHQKDDEDR